MRPPLDLRTIFAKSIDGMNALDWPPLWTLLFVLIATAMGALWSPFDEEAAVVGFALIAVAVALALWAAFTLKRARTPIIPGKAPEALVTDGPFRLSRNPIYLADLGVVAGWAMVMGQPLGLFLIWPLANILERRFIAHEERRLADAFGPAFDAYRAKTGRWV